MRCGGWLAGDWGGDGWPVGGRLVAKTAANRSWGGGAGHEVEREKRKMGVCVCVFTWLKLLCLHVSTWQIL